MDTEIRYPTEIIHGIEAKAVIPDHKLMLVECSSRDEAYYLSGMLNSSPARFSAASYAVEIQLDPHLLQNINIPPFDPQNTLHLRLVELSQRAHEVAQNEDKERLRTIEDAIDETAARIWELTSTELGEIRQSLVEMQGER